MQLDTVKESIYCFVPLFNTRGVTIHFNNDSIRVMIRRCRYDSRTILVHSERSDPMRFSGMKLNFLAKNSTSVTVK